MLGGLHALAKYCIAYGSWKLGQERRIDPYGAPSIGSSPTIHCQPSCDVSHSPSRLGSKLLRGWQTAYVRIPIACTLTSEEAIDRVNEWQRFLADSTGAVERVNEQRLRIR